MIVALLGLCLFAASPAEAPSSFKPKYGKEIVEEIKGAGQLQLHGTTVTNTVEITGSLLCQDAKISNLFVLGEANLRRSKVENTGSFVGYLQAHQSTFSGPIVLTSQKAVFTASTLSGITFKRDGAYKGKQFLELKQKTIVDGPVIFEGGKGEIYIYSGSKILGKVEGGKKIYKN